MKKSLVQVAPLWNFQNPNPKIPNLGYPTPITKLCQNFNYVKIDRIQFMMNLRAMIIPNIAYMIIINNNNISTSV